MRASLPDIEVVLQFQARYLRRTNLPMSLTTASKFVAARENFGLVAAPLLLALLAGCGTHRRQARTPDAEPGGIQFQSYCAACHRYDGQGMGDAPPLDGSPWVTGPGDRLIRIVLHGVHGPIEVHGKQYDQEMPGFGQILSDADVASLLSFLRRRFGAPSEPITPETVSRVRAANQTRTDYWSVQELLEKP
jgi:mono/diheme cytochrome c family protein